MVDAENGKDLIPVTIFEGHNDSIFELSKKLTEKVQLAKNNKDKAHSEITKVFLTIPTFLLGIIGTVCSYLG